MSPEQLAEATRRFLEKNPKLAAKIDSAAISDAQRHDVSEDETRRFHVERAIGQQARTFNLDPYRYLLRLGIDDPAERERLSEAYDREAAQELGMSLEEYRKPVAAQ
ncbi:DUF6388 family protein [Robbsia sp. KACC 23696]|uniref:DUF6388 family protein n=1 Tax=Robbsia sp. KACC 23696 TaxID=3149231 RepID=UPI00325AAB25